jgi:phytoene dehydrogenase-like protein
MSATRREMLRVLLGAPFVSLLACDEAPPPRVPDGELLGPDLALGHRLREPLPRDAWNDAPTRRLAVAIVGGGPAGLSAGWRLARRGVLDFALVDLEPVVGGTSRSARSEVTRYPWGAHYLPMPPASNADLRGLLVEMGAYVRGAAAEEVLVREPEERVFYRGYWYPGLYPFAGASEDDLAELRRFEALVATYVGAFASPFVRSGREHLALDSESAAHFLDRHRFVSPRLRWLAEYATRDDYGLALADTSAWAFLFYWASRVEPRSADDASGVRDGAPVLTWPEGNGALVDHLAGVIGERITTGALATHVFEDSAGVHVLLQSSDGSRERLLADHAVLALPRFVAARIAPELRLAREGFDYGAWAVANVHLRERPDERGFPPAWDNVIYDSPSLGYVTATHQRGRDVGPSVWTWYLPFTDADPDEGRARLFAAEHGDLAEACVRDLRRAHPGLDACIERVDVWRWGHAMVQPRVGYLRGGERFDAPFVHGSIRLAHSDLSGLALFEEAFFHGVRAADHVWDAYIGGVGSTAPSTVPSEAG